MVHEGPGAVLLRPAALGGAGIGAWFCVTVVLLAPDPLREATDVASVAEVARRLGADPASAVRWDRDLEPFWRADDDHPVLVSVVPVEADGEDRPADRAVVLLEVNGFQGSRPEVLAALSAHGEAMSLFRGVRSDRVSWARDGRLLVSVDPSAPHARTGTAPDSLGDVLDALVEAVAAEHVAEDADEVGPVALALLGLVTGVRLDDAWWAGEQVLLVAPDDAGPADADGLPTDVGEALDALGRDAVADPAGPVAELMVTTLQDAVRAALHFTGLAEDVDLGPALSRGVAEAGLLRRLALDGDPAVEAESAAAQQRVGPAVAALWDDHGRAARAARVAADAAQGAPADAWPDPQDDPVWQRLQAGIAVTELLAWAVAPPPGPDVPGTGHSPADVLLHVRFALGDRWPAFEDALAAHLAAHLG